MTNNYSDALITLAIAANLDFDGDIITVINNITGEEVMLYVNVRDGVIEEIQQWLNLGGITNEKDCK